jgi:excisionase family DNA binding protein
MDDILTAEQVAELLQIHVRTVYKLVRKGLLPGRKFGGGWRFSKNEILKMVAANEGARSSEGENPASRDWSVEKGEAK